MNKKRPVRKPVAPHTVVSKRHRKRSTTIRKPTGSVTAINLDKGTA